MIHMIEKKINKDNLVIIAGMPRGGTTYMYEALAPHPEIYLPIVKETNYFSYNYKDRGEKWFKELYQNAKSSQKMFDISPFYYMEIDEFIENTKDWNRSNQKVIMTLRDPNDWAWSCYKQYQKQNYDNTSFDEFVKKFEINFESRKYNYDLRSFDYIERVEKLKKAFKGNLLLIDFEFFQNNKEQVLNEIEDFIGINKFFEDNNIINHKVNASYVKHNKMITYLSKFTLLRNIAFKILSEKMIHHIRNKYIYGVAVEENEKRQKLYDFDNIYQEKYFTESPFLRC